MLKDTHLFHCETTAALRLFTGAIQMRGPTVYCRLTVVDMWHASCAMRVKQNYHNGHIFLLTHNVEDSKYAHTVLTRCLECPEVDVDQYKVDHSWAILFAFPWFEDIAFLQAFAVEDFGIDLGEWKLVHSSPFLCHQDFLWQTFEKACEKMCPRFCACMDNCSSHLRKNTLNGGLESLGRAEKSNEMMRSTPRCGRRMRG